MSTGGVGSGGPEKIGAQENAGLQQQAKEQTSSGKDISVQAEDFKHQLHPSGEKSGKSKKKAVKKTRDQFDPLRPAAKKPGGKDEEQAVELQQEMQREGQNQIQLQDAKAAMDASEISQMQLSHADDIEKRSEIVSKIEASARLLSTSADGSRINVQLDEALLPGTSFALNAAEDGSIQLTFNTTSVDSEGFLRLHADAMMSDVSRDLGTKVTLVVRQDGDEKGGHQRNNQQERDEL